MHRHRPAHHHRGGDVDEVDPHHLGDEGEAARGAQVTFDHADVVALRQELDVEGPMDLERRGDARRDAPDAADGLEIGALRRQHEGRVARMYARVLDVLRYRRDDEIAL